MDIKPKGMPEIPFELLLEEIRANQIRLDTCKRHCFPTWPPIEQTPTLIGLKVDCCNCGGRMDALHAYAYTRGFEAAGGNPNEVIPGWR